MHLHHPVEMILFSILFMYVCVCAAFIDLCVCVCVCVCVCWICIHVRVAPLRMGARQAALGSQVLWYFEVICCLSKAAFSWKGSLYVPLFKSFGKEIHQFFCSNLEIAKSLEKQQNRSSNEIPTQHYLGLFPEKESHTGCLSRKRLPLIGSIVLGNLIGPSFLELPV